MAWVLHACRTRGCSDAAGALPIVELRIEVLKAWLLLFDISTWLGDDMPAAPYASLGHVAAMARLRMLL